MYLFKFPAQLPTWACFNVSRGVQAEMKRQGWAVSIEKLLANQMEWNRKLRLETRMCAITSALMHDFCTPHPPLIISSYWALLRWSVSILLVRVVHLKAVDPPQALYSCHPSLCALSYLDFIYYLCKYKQMWLALILLAVTWPPHPTPHLSYNITHICHHILLLL